MTLRTDHATTITPELSALAELVYLVELALGDDSSAAALAELQQALDRAKQLVAERLMQRTGTLANLPPLFAVALRRIALADNAHRQLTLALADYRGQ